MLWYQEGRLSRWSSERKQEADGESIVVPDFLGLFPAHLSFSFSLPFLSSLSLSRTTVPRLTPWVISLNRKRLVVWRLSRDDGIGTTDTTMDKRVPLSFSFFCCSALPLFPSPSFAQCHLSTHKGRSVQEDVFLPCPVLPFPSTRPLWLIFQSMVDFFAPGFCVSHG